MPQVHDREEGPSQGTPSPQALAEALSIECPVCQASPGTYCPKKIGFDTVEGLHAKRAEAFEALALQKVLNSEWSFIRACDHGSHHWCYPCMSAFWTPEKRESRCARCGDWLEQPSGEIPGAVKSIVSDGEDSWHIECTPDVILKKSE